MCIYPKTIRNRTKNYIKGVTPEYVQVPCGHCHECRQSMQQNWSVRAWRMVKSYRERGGMTVFLTLTYRNSCLPVFFPGSASLSHGYLDKSGKPHKTAIPCFDPKDKDTFLNSFRKHFEILGVTDIKYMWCCEYGQDSRYTQRSHYHVLIHLPILYPEKLLKDLVERLWHYGDVRYSDKGLVVQDDQACKYVAKYMTKDLSYFQNSRVTDYIFDSNGKIIDSNFNNLKPYMAKHWQSQGYGIQLVDDILSLSPDQQENCFFYGVEIPDESLRNGKKAYYPIPQYIFNKLCYKTLDNGTRVISDYGYNMFGRLFERKVLREVDNLASLFSVENLLSNLSEESLLTICQEFSLPCFTHADLSQYLTQNIITIIHILFNKVLKSREITEHYHLDTFQDSETLCKYIFSIYHIQLHKMLRLAHEVPGVAVFCDVGYFSKYSLGKHTYDHYYNFESESYYHDLIARIRGEISLSRIKARLEKAHQKQILTHLYKSV